MSRATRFAVAVHALALLDHPYTREFCSDKMAGSIGTNASFVRRVLAMLSRAGITRSAAGIAGAQLARPAAEISLYDIYRAVGMEAEHRLAVHAEPNPHCAIGRHIQSALDAAIGPAEAAFEAALKERTLEDVKRLIAVRAA